MQREVSTQISVSVFRRHKTWQHLKYTRNTLCSRRESMLFKIVQMRFLPAKYASTSIFFHAVALEVPIPSRCAACIGKQKGLCTYVRVHFKILQVVIINPSPAFRRPSHNAALGNRTYIVQYKPLRICVLHASRVAHVKKHSMLCRYTLSHLERFQSCDAAARLHYLPDRTAHSLVCSADTERSM